MLFWCVPGEPAGPARSLVGTPGVGGPQNDKNSENTMATFRTADHLHRMSPLTNIAERRMITSSYLNLAPIYFVQAF
jgi:hypothetical protein